MALARAFDERLQRLIKAFETIGDPGTQSQLAQKMGRRMLQLIDHSIASSTDCYGHPMPPRIDDGAAPLQGLRGTFAATFTGNGVRVSSSKWYAKVHNRGWKITAKNGPNLKFRLPSGRFVSKPSVTIPRRQMVPSQSTGGLGPIWGPALNEVMAAFMRDHMRGR
jgi:hypothetical protein